MRMLTTIFSGKDGTKEEPLRRKYPVFCATGVKPYIVSIVEDTKEGQCNV